LYITIRSDLHHILFKNIVASLTQIRYFVNMNLLDKVSNIMSTDVICVNEDDTLASVRHIFQRHRIHHIPVLRDGLFVGILSKSDFSFFKKGFNDNPNNKIIQDVRLNNYTAKDIMTTKVAKLSKDDRINVVLEIFKENLFHAIPIIEDEKIVGIVTTYDIIKALADAKDVVSEYN